MKKIILLLMICGCNKGFSQSIIISGGAATSAFDWKISGGKAYDETVTNIYASIGMEYLDKKYFSFTSAVSYLNKGGASTVQVTDQSGNDLYILKMK